MVILLLIFQLILCSIILYREVVSRHFRNFATSVFFIVYAIVYIVEPLILHIVFGGARSIVAGSARQFNNPAVYYLFHAYGIGLLLTSLVINRSRKSYIMIRPVGPKSNMNGSADQTNYLAILIIAGALLFLYSTGMNLSELFIASRFSWFDSDGFSIFWMTVSSYCISLTALLAYQVKLSQDRNYWLLAVCLGVIVLEGIITKERKWPIFLVSGWIAAQYELSGRELYVKWRVIIGFMLLLFVFIISQFIRDVMPRYFIGQKINFTDEIVKWQSFLIEYGDISYFYRASLEAIHQNLNNGFIIPMGVFRRIVFFMLPTSYSCGLKVEDIAATFSDLVDGGDAIRRGNMPPGLFGLFTISFGSYISLFLIPMLALLLRKLDLLFRTGVGTLRSAVLALYVFSVLLAFRGDESSAFYFVVFAFISIFLIKTIQARKAGQV